MSLDHTEGGTGVPKTYSNVHDTTEDAPLHRLLDVDTNDSRSNNEKKIDAHARIAGEAARWVAVREHVGGLGNSSCFYVDHPEDGGITEADRRVIYVSFNTLWLSWEPVFEKKYNISNAVFAGKLVSSNAWGGAGKVTDKHRHNMTGNDKLIGA